MSPNKDHQLTKQKIFTQLSQLYSAGMPQNFNWDYDEDEHSLAPLISKVNSEPTPLQAQKMIFFDEGLRDALGRVKIIPEPSKALTYLEMISAFGIKHTLVGMYAGRKTVNDKNIKKILKALAQDLPEMVPVLGMPTLADAVEWGQECQAINPNVGVALFRGTAPLRMFAEGWTVEQVKRDITQIFKMAAKSKLPIYGTIEHATQTPPWFLKEIIETMVKSSGKMLKMLIVTDTAGIAGAVGTQRLFKFVDQCLKDLEAEQVQIKIHNHNDRGLATSNALVAIANGATVAGVAPWGDGERAGNLSLEAMVANLYYILREHNMKPAWDQKKLNNVSQAYGQLINEPVPTSGPLADNAFSSCFGTHLAAEYKMMQIIEELNETQKQLQQMKDAIHSPWGSQEWNRASKVVVTASTGIKGIKLKAKVDFNLDLNDEIAAKIYQVACQKTTPLTDKEFAQFLEN